VIDHFTYIFKLHNNFAGITIKQDIYYNINYLLLIKSLSPHYTILSSNMYLLAEIPQRILQTFI